MIHRRELLTAEQFQNRLEAARAKVLRAGTHNVPATNHCRNLAKRFEEHGESYFRFITTPGVEPTNNLAKRAIRFVVIDRLITQGTRSETGNRWCERIWTVIATCTQQGRFGVRVPGGSGWGLVRWNRAADVVTRSLKQVRTGGVLGCKVSRDREV